MNRFWIAPFLAGLFFLIPSIHGESMIQNFDGGMSVEINFPDEIIVGREGIISVLVKNNGWEEKQDISFEFSLSEIPGLMIEPNNVSIKKLAEGGSYGENVNLIITKDANPGIHFINIKYSQILVSNNEIPQKPFYQDIAIPIIIKEDPNVTIHTKIPESIFTNAEFPVDIEIVSEDIDITDVKIKIIPPSDIQFRGETMHAFSKIEKNSPVGITSRIITPTQEVNTEYKLPFEIIVEYTNDIGEQKEDSQTVSVVLRPRTFMELTTDGGIWIGDFFIAPYVSLGTIIGIPAGAIISLLVRRRTTPKKPARRKKP